MNELKRPRHEIVKIHSGRLIAKEFRNFPIGVGVDLPFFVGNFVGNFVEMKAVSEVGDPLD